MSVGSLGIGPVRPAPWWVGAGAGAVALVTGLLIAQPAGGFIALFLLSAVVMLCRVVAVPVRGFLMCLGVFPVYTVVRGVILLYNLPVPVAVVGIWPEVILALVGVGLTVQACRAGRRFPFTWHDLPVLVLLLGCLYATIISLLVGDMAAAAYGSHATAMPFLFYFVARWLRPTPAEVRHLLTFWLLSFAALALLSLADYALRPDFIIRLAIVIRPNFWVNWPPVVFFKWYPRMQSLLFAEQIWGTLCAFVAIYCLARSDRRAAGSAAPWWNIPVLLLSLLCLTLSMSRGAFICFSVATVLLLGFRGLHRRYIAMLCAALVVAGVGGAIMFSGNERVVSLVTRVTALGDVNNRLAYDRVDQWQIALRNFPLYPSGIGLGRAGAAAYFHGLGESDKIVVDGGYFKILAEQGAPGLLSFIISAIGLAWVLLRAAWRATEEPYRALCRTAFCLWCGLAIHNIGGNIFDSYYLAPVFWLLAGLAVSAPATAAPQASNKSRQLALNSLPVGDRGE